MTIQQIAKDLLRYIGVVNSLDATANLTNLSTVTPDALDLQFVATTINGAYQEIFAGAPAALRERDVAEVLRAPTTVTVDATQFSKTIANLTTYASWMIGCTIRIPGDNQDNEIVSSTALLRPFMGTTATGISSTVYADCIALDSTYSRVLGPVGIPGNPILRNARSKEEFVFGTGQEWSTPDGNSIQPDPISSWQRQKTLGQPAVWFTEARYDGTNTYLPLMLRFNPMPSSALAVGFKAKVKPPTVTTASIGTDAGTDTNITIPMDWVESILLPVSRQRFKAHPRFQASAESVAQITADYKIAIEILNDLSAQTSTVSAPFPR
jgi:hypothetical protein